MAPILKKLARVALMVGAGLLGGWAITGFDAPLQSKRDRIEAILTAPPVGEVYLAVREYYPEEADRWLTQTEILLSDSARREANPDAGFDIGSDIRRRHAHKLAAASDQSLRAVIDGNIDMYSWSRSDPALCGRLLVEGPMVLSREARRDFLERIDAALLWRVIHEGDTRPVRRGASTDADWEEFLEVYYASGETEDDLYAVMTADAGDPTFCDAMLDYLAIIRDADFPGADRIRAEVAVAIAES